MSLRPLIVHGHFYQPPRDDPWTGEIDREPSAAPYHDWNERIDAECYRANAFARIYQRDRVLDLVDNYRFLSANFGPTLARWLERHAPTAIDRAVAADREARARLGWGGGVAQAYHHAILPLCDALDRATQIRWGLEDFRHRYGHAAPGMWLPECAADRATLADLIDHGLAFAVLAPRQARRVRPPGGDWREASRLDTGRGYRFLHPDGSGRSLALFFYDGDLAHAVAFGGALRSSAHLVAALEEASLRTDGLVHIAVDGETFGHHHRWGERVLAWTLGHEMSRRGFRLSNYAAELAAAPPTWEVELDLGEDGRGSSWSCAHGVGRWERDCGCRLTPGAQQSWRGPLRAALDLLRDRSRLFYAVEAGELLRDPWRARDAAGGLLADRSAEAAAHFLAEHGRRELRPRERRHALALLEMQRRLLAMYASCGWFFDDVAGLEARLVMRQAARAIDLWAELGGDPPVSDALDLLAAARSNDPASGSGADVFRRVLARPAARAALTPETPRPLLSALRRWAEASGERAIDAARQALTILAPPGPREVPEVWERAQEIFWSARFDGAALRTGAPDLAEGLGFAPAALRERMAAAPVAPLGPALEEAP
jgi:alpha-amylase/alpha-mannosidase (GH57 family)